MSSKSSVKIEAFMKFWHSIELKGRDPYAPEVYLPVSEVIKGTELFCVRKRQVGL